MSKGQKSMDEVLASIRKIIRTDPTAAPPEIGSSSQGGVVGDETAREVLEKLRREREGADAEDREAGKPLSASDDPDEAARAVLDHLRRQAETEARQELERPAAPAEEEPAADLAPTPDEPPAVAADEAAVPVVDEPAAGPGADAGAEEGRRMMEPQKALVPDPELPQPAAAPARGDRGSREAPVMVDEAALEAMIRRVVRDELMGDMGRRITRNVVKLIREEIAKSRIEEK